MTKTITFDMQGTYLIFIFFLINTSKLNTEAHSHVHVKVARKQANTPPLITNIPFIYTQNNTKHPPEYNTTCAKFPQLDDIKFTSDFWQTQKTSNGTLQLLNAYIDDRGLSDKLAVRILGLYDQFDSEETFYCQIWFDQIEVPDIVKSQKLLWIWHRNWGGNRPDWYHPYIITCSITKGNIPISVSVVEDPCDSATNNLGISYKKVPEEEKKDVVVCAKSLDSPYKDQSTRLVEWIELLFILGAEKVNFYELNVHTNTTQVFDYYSSQGKVEVTPTTLIGGASNTVYYQTKAWKEKAMERRLQEVVLYNDCVYKHLQEFKFVVILGANEVIAPSDGTWIKLLNSVRTEGRSSYMTRRVNFLNGFHHHFAWFEGIPRYLHKLQYVYRNKNYTESGKFDGGFYDTQKVVALHSHFPLKCLGACRRYAIDIDLAHLQHYHNCVQDCDVVKSKSVMDFHLWEYKNELIAKAVRVLTDLDLL